MGATLTSGIEMNLRAVLAIYLLINGIAGQLTFGCSEIALSLDKVLSGWMTAWGTQNSAAMVRQAYP
jgi:hypothetical protein